ncbi:MAG: tetratricopeptide repeat protein [Anaerolineae bacterium]|nr:tetratricopeptide repeat protein [Anaerolineae bacterium]
MPYDHIIDVTEASFEFDVLAYSENTPVLIDFWAEWCQPCKTLGPILERLALEAGGAFRLARVNVDQNPNLALRYGVRSIPTVKAISQRNVVSEFSGVMPENRVREFIAHITPPSPLELSIEKAESLLVLQQYALAEIEFRSVIESDPDHPAALLGLAKSLLAQGAAQEAGLILEGFPASRQLGEAQALLPLTAAMTDLKENTLKVETDQDIAFQNCLRLVSKGNLPAALDGLLDILRQDKRYRGGQARLIYLAILEIMGDQDAQARQYRAELASVLF